MAIHMQEVGKSLYLFTTGVGSYADECVISAHGGYSSSTKKFSVQATSLKYYVNHGDVQQDFGIAKFGGTGITKPEVIEPIGAGQQSYNYELSKYQGRHGGTKNKPAETYDSIKGEQISINEAVEAQKLMIEKLIAKGESQDRLDKVRAAVSRSFDVVTVRNRWFSSGTNLKDVIAQISKVHKYSVYHCFFCRSKM